VVVLMVFDEVKGMKVDELFKFDCEFIFELLGIDIFVMWMKCVLFSLKVFKGVGFGYEVEWE